MSPKSDKKYVKQEQKVIYMYTPNRGFYCVDFHWTHVTI
jgi:hypothetical protein